MLEFCPTLFSIMRLQLLLHIYKYRQHGVLTLHKFFILSLLILLIFLTPNSIPIKLFICTVLFLDFFSSFYNNVPLPYTKAGTNMICKNFAHSKHKPFVLTNPFIAPATFLPWINLITISASPFLLLFTKVPNKQALPNFCMHVCINACCMARKSLALLL